MMYRLYIFLLIFIYSNLLEAQNFALSGHIYYNDRSQILPFATIKSLSSKKDFLSDENGKYNIKVVRNDTIICSYVGCIPKQVVVNNQDSVDIVLAPDTFLLKDIVVKGKYKPVQMSTNGLMVNVSNMRTDGKMLTDVLNQMPTIKVTGQSINMSGKNAVLVYINQHQIYLEGSDLITYLNSLSPGIIKKVEIISTPPVQYEAEGNVGIVKIETSKNINPGWQGRIQSLYCQAYYPSYGGSVHLNYVGKKFSIDGVFLGTKSIEYNKSCYTNYFKDETVSTYYPRRSKEKILHTFLTLNYDVNVNNQLSATFQIPLYNRTNTCDLDNTTKYICNTDYSVDSIMTSKGDELSNKNLFSSELFYKRIFHNDSYLMMTVGYINNNVKNNRTWLSSLKSKKLCNDDENNISQGHQKYNIYTGKVDYYYNIKDLELYGGYKMTYTYSSSLNSLVNDGLVKDISASDQFDYDEFIHAFYLNMSKSFGHLSFKSGLRAEYTHTKCYSYNLEEIDKNHYFKFFTLVGLGYMFDNNNIFNLSYSNRVKRPQYQMFDPFRWYISKYDYSVGDPFLKPAYINNIELTYLHGNALFCKFYYSHTSNEVGRMVILDTLSIQNQIEKAGNFFKISTLGVNLNYAMTLCTWFESTFNGELTHSKYYSRNAAFREISGWGGVLSIDNYFNIGHNFVLSLYLEDDVPGYYNYRKNDNSFLMNASISFVNNKKNVLLKLDANDIFKTSASKYYYYSNDIKQEYDNYYDSRYVNIVFTWKFGNIFNKNKKHFESSNAEEKDRL